MATVISSTNTLPLLNILLDCSSQNSRNKTTTAISINNTRPTHYYIFKRQQQFAANFLSFLHNVSDEQPHHPC